jgi:hypothetical protein
MDRRFPFNWDAAKAAFESITDPVTRNLVQIGLAQAQLKYIMRGEETEADVQRRLPILAFDLRFFVDIMVGVCSQHDAIRKILDGASVAEATGWDE